MMTMHSMILLGGCLAAVLAGGARGERAVSPGGPSSPATSSASTVAKQPLSGSLTSGGTGSSDFETRATAFGGHGWVTRPNRDVVMAFTFPVEIAEVAVKNGQPVKAGQLLIRARDGDAVASVEVQKVRAANDAPVLNARAGLELAQLRFDAAERARADKAMNPQEFDERRLALTAAQAQLANALSTQQEEQKRVVQMQEQAQRYRLEARFDGVVDLVAAEPGQGVDINQPIVHVVNIDPLWIDVPTPTEETLRLKLAEGSPAWVLMDAPAESGGLEPIRGSVLSVASVTDSAGTRRVRVELPNPRLLPAGLRAQVRFSQPEMNERR